MWYLVDDSARDGDGNGDGGSCSDDNVDGGDGYVGEGNILMVIRVVMAMMVAFCVDGNDGHDNDGDDSGKRLHLAFENLG